MLFRALGSFILLTALLCSPANARVIDWWGDIYGRNSANTTAAFLTLPTSAGQLARGLASSPGNMDASDLSHFPANSALTFRHQFSISHLEWLMGIRKQYAAAALPLIDVGTFGFYFRNLSSGTFRYARDIDEQPADPTYREYVLGLSFARSFLRQKLNFGLNSTLVGSRLDKDRGYAFSAGADVLYAPSERFSTRLYLLNAGTPISYGGSGSDPLPLQSGFSVNIAPLRSENHSTPELDFDLGLGLQKTADEPLVTGISTEIRTGPHLFWRAGYEHSAGTSMSLGGLSAGMGFHYGIYGLDAGWKLQSEYFGSVWAANFNLQLEELTPKTADDYYRTAVRHYNRNRRMLARHFLNKALKTDPGHWHSHDLLSKMRSETLRDENLEIGIIYTGNSRGEVIPYPPAPDALGGLSRQATLVNNLGGSYQTAFSLNSGNMVTELSHPLRVELIQDYYSHLQYDIIAPGEGEAPFFPELFNRRDGIRSNVVLTNHRQLPGRMVEYEMINKGGYKLFFTNVIGTSKVKEERVSSNLSGIYEELTLALNTRYAKESHVRVAVIHENWETVRAVAEAFPQLDIIICGSLDQRFDTPMKVNSAVVVSAGKGGKYVGALSLRFNRDRQLIATTNRLYPLTEAIPEDPYIQDRINLVSAKLELTESGIDFFSQGLYGGIVPFVSTRNGTRQAYVKAMEILSEIPLAPEHYRSFSPQISTETQMALYLREEPESADTTLEVLRLSTFGRRKVAGSQNVSEAIFSNDGKWIYFVGTDSGCTSRTIYRTPATVRDEIEMVIDKPNAPVRDLTFSPDGELMLFAALRDGFWQIYTTNPEGMHPTLRTEENANHIAPSFSPDGRYIAYLSDRRSISGRYNLWVFDSRSSTHKQITFNSRVQNFCWTDTSNHIVFSSGVNVFDLNIADIANNKTSKLIDSNEMKTWSEINPGFLVFSGSRKIVYTREYRDGSRSVHWFDLDSKTNHRIINSSGNDWTE
ncbi:hypothetical protein QA601_09630 [Chitinispirillales bacterium ANBcel5]|uniref:hypothetical protein n=1 Tax=Cellulosispirillum alkaliphilum TaxID=3039283 RepID=UPI002A563F6B|nr:hypothetical protein [Chitinispirillales bacterium ANBcel5]